MRTILCSSLNSSESSYSFTLSKHNDVTLNEVIFMYDGIDFIAWGSVIFIQPERDIFVVQLLDSFWGNE